MSANKENFDNSTKRSMRQSSGSLKKIPLNVEEDNSATITSNLAQYMDYIRKLEGDNENLKAERSLIITSCNEKILSNSTTYGAEIVALRKALDEYTMDKHSTEYHNGKLLEENTNLKIKFARKIDEMKDLERRFEKAESNLIKNRRAAEQYETMCQENEDLARTNSLAQEQLTMEVRKRTEAENRMVTLSDELEFNKKLSNNNATLTTEVSTSINNEREAYYMEKFDLEMTNMREEMTEEFDEYKWQIEQAFNKKVEDLTSMNTKLNEKCNKIYNEKKTLLSRNGELQNDISVLESKVDAMSARDARHSEFIDKINTEHNHFVSDIIEENANLKIKIDELGGELTDLVNTKIAHEKEAQMFRTMLKGERSRCNLPDLSSTKKRRVTKDDDDSHEIVAWSKDKIKMFCDASYDGNFVQLLNDSFMDVNLNEWKVVIETAAGEELLYTFAPRIINPGKTLKVWSMGQGVSEDDDNLVMNVSLPALDIMTFKLNNDMDETEASFDLKKAAIKRKILKAKKADKAEKCSLM